MSETRPNPDALLAQLDRQTQGQLKVFLGAAPGVGKTWEMLASAQALAREGRDVLIGVVETHGRAGTERQIGDLPVLPRSAIAYRGQVLEEFDVDAALARHPGLLLVDELAHTNAPGSRHNKRWEDVAELLEAGIDVWATLNVQHLESLNDDVARITGVRVRETLPDRVLELAHEIEFIDISPTELRTRLRDGQIYRPDVAARALDSFFREGNLAALREIGLRRAAQRVDQDVRSYMRENAVAGIWPASERVLALVGSDAGAEAVVRQAKRLADALRAPWLALHLEPRDAIEAHRPALDMATDLGAEVEIRAGGPLVQTTLEVARARNVTHLVIGRGRPTRWRRLTGQTLAGTLVRQGPEFSLHVVPAGGQPLPARRVQSWPRGWFPWVASVALVASVVGLGELLHAYLEHEALGMLFLAAVVGAAIVWGMPVALSTAALSFLSWNFFFIPPVGQLTIGEPRDVIAIVVFAGVATATGWMASRLRREAAAGQGRIESLRRMSAFTRRLSATATEADLLAEIARLAADIVSPALVLMREGEDLNIRAADPPTHDTMDDGSWAAARWCAARQEQAGRGTATLPSAAWRFVPLGKPGEAAGGASFGVIGVRPSGPLEQPLTQSLTALADQAASALDRARLAASAARAQAQAHTQKLRTALMNSLGHDLRTPLTSIRGAAGSLRTAWTTLSAEDRADLLASIEQDTVRMTRFLTNITDLTRVETGELVPLKEPVTVRDAVTSAASLVPGLTNMRLNVADSLPALAADPALLEHVLVNVLENAAKYAPASAEVSVSAQALDAEISVAITDQGPGIPPDDLPHVFDSFYRAQRGDRTVPGTGLGLAIARGMMEAMGGTIEARSPQPGRTEGQAVGTTIVLRLPAWR